MTEWMNERMNEWNEWSEWSEMKELLIEWIEIKELKQNEWIEILPTSSSKSAPTETVFLNMFKWKSSSRYSPGCALVDHFPRPSRETAETETLLRRPRRPPYPKKCRVSRPRVFSSLNSRVPDLSHFPTTCMMMWLPWWLRWWCGCHHAERASYDNRS